jgi:hypothetical protein
VRQPTPPRFVRDHIEHSDIEGSKPKKIAYFETRDVMNTNDIPGTRSKQLHAPRKNENEYNNMNYSDVTK